MKLTTVLSSKGQLVLPKSLRDSLQWPSGTRLEIEATAEGVLLRPAGHFPATTSAEVFGSLPSTGGPKSLEDMDAAILAEARRRHDRH